MATTKRRNDETTKPIGRWLQRLEAYEANLPRHREYYAPGRWRYAMTDAERLAAGWVRTEGWASETDPEKIGAWSPKDAADLARGPMRSLGMVNWLLTRPDPIRKASLALADATDDLAVEIERRGKSSAAAIRLAEMLRDGTDPGQHTVAALDDVRRLLREMEFATAAKRGKPNERDNDAVDQRKAERRKWVLSVVRKHRHRARNTAELLRWLAMDGEQSTSRDTLKRDLRDALALGEAEAAELPPLRR